MVRVATSGSRKVSFSILKDKKYGLGSHLTLCQRKHADLSIDALMQMGSSRIENHQKLASAGESSAIDPRIWGVLCRECKEPCNHSSRHRWHDYLKSWFGWYPWRRRNCQARKYVRRLNRCGSTRAIAYWSDTKTSHSFVYTDPVGRNSLFMSTTVSTGSNFNESGRSITPFLDNV